jgi:hypothetical protein
MTTGHGCGAGAVSGTAAALQETDVIFPVNVVTPPMTSLKVAVPAAGEATNTGVELGPNVHNGNGLAGLKDSFVGSTIVTVQVYGVCGVPTSVSVLPESVIVYGWAVPLAPESVPLPVPENANLWSFVGCVNGKTVDPPWD